MPLTLTALRYRRFGVWTGVISPSEYADTMERLGFDESEQEAIGALARRFQDADAETWLIEMERAGVHKVRRRPVELPAEDETPAGIPAAATA